MQRTNAKIVSAGLPQKLVETPDFQGFLHTDPYRKPANIDVRGRILSQPLNSGLKPRAL
jgi:hypothetical protein